PTPVQEIIGSSVGEVLQGSAGNDRIDGGAGLDWVRSEGARDAHQITRQADGSWLVESDAGGRDVLINVERLTFDDGSLALDLQGGGQAALAVRLIGAVAGPEAAKDPALVGEVLSYLDTLGEAGFLRALDELGVFAQRAGGSDSASLLTLLHTQVTGRAPDADELAQMLDLQHALGLDTAGTVAWAARLPQTAERIDLEALAREGLAFQSFGGLLLGSAQGDRLSAVPNGQQIDGREGLDTLVYGGERSDYVVERQADGSYTVEARQSGAIDHLWNVERLEFSDAGVALDLDGQAGDALKLLQVLGGDGALENTEWVGQAIRYVDDMGVPAAAQAALQAGWAGPLSGDTSLEALLAQVYTHVTGAAPSADELQWHLDFAQTQALDAAELLVMAVELPVTVQRIDLVGLAQQGVAYEVWEG
ncbi:MAG TPA: hypothetical protein VN156_05865, partial [Pseudomonas sp.]|nr:hypothetical protein [Pseudomonas sp.]